MPNLSAQALQYTYETTQDGSPTVRILAAGAETSEAMHSLKGAFSETLYIYGTAINLCLEKGFRPRVLSMGLGLGYVEILAAASFLKFGAATDAGGVSFEIVPELRDWFCAWVRSESSVPERFCQMYDEILNRTCAHREVSSEDVRDFLRKMIASGSWQIKGALNAETEFEKPFGCICFDAFSSKTSPDLWTEEFLNRFLEKAADSQCVLSTYACTGALKRALKANDFDVNIREGFSSKRDSTFAVRLRTQ